MNFTGPVADFLHCRTREISIEGGFRAGKTTAALWKIRKSIEDHPGIQWFLCRYSNSDTQTKLKPAFEDVCQKFGGEMPAWNEKEQCYQFPNTSRAIIFGLKAADALSRYSKLRGLGVAGILVDEAQEMPPDIALELRGRLSQSGFPIQLIFVSNPMNTTSWLAKQFPTDNSKANRKYFAISLYDNAANLPEDMIAGLEAAYPPEHAKYASVILGQRGVNVMGEPVYAGAFDRKRHVAPVQFDEDTPLFEGIDFGQQNTAVVWAQPQYAGGIVFLGGVLGQEMFLDHFLRIVKDQRAEWFPGLTKRTLKTCCPPPAASQAVRGERYTNVSVLRSHGFNPIHNDHSNSPDVVLALIERMAGYMRRKNVSDMESLIVNADESRWLRASREGIEPCPFLAQGFEAGYVWDDHRVSVSNDSIRQPKDDDWFSHGMRAAQNIELNFLAHRGTPLEHDQRLRKRYASQARHAEQRATLAGPNGWLA